VLQDRTAALICDVEGVDLAASGRLSLGPPVLTTGVPGVQLVAAVEIAGVVGTEADVDLPDVP
jgi:hypothetical protein